MIDPRYDYKELHMNRRSGILLPLFALPSTYGIGSMGAAAIIFIDFLKKAGQTYWQLLPLGPTGYGNSPYSSLSSFAGNPYFIDLDILAADGFLTKEELAAAKVNTFDAVRIDYGNLYQNRLPLLKKAYQRFSTKKEQMAQLDSFLDEHKSWLEDYALFSAIRSTYSDAPWYKWPSDIRNREPPQLMAARRNLQEPFHFAVFLQYVFQQQWNMLKTTAHQAGIQLIGDLPIYCAHDSADVWAHPNVFSVNSDGSLLFEGGCPPIDFDVPDSFGQVWGTPVYNWDYLEKSGFDWMLARFTRQAAFYDVLRLDHFRGYESFWRIPAGSSERAGSWERAEGWKLFSLLRQNIPSLRIIAEDLGYITQEVVALRKGYGYPSMRILGSGLNPVEPNEHTPHNYEADTVLYFGIHDNAPLSVWFSGLKRQEWEYFFDYLHIEPTLPYERLPFEVIKAMAASIADTVIYQVPDILLLGEQARINVPGRACGNWEWMLTEEQLKILIDYASELAHITKLYGRT